MTGSIAAARRGRHETGGAGSSRHRQSREQICEQVAGRDFVELLLDGRSRKRGQPEPHDETYERWSHTLSHDQPEHAEGPCPKRHPDADFASPL